uniref:TNFR-Cys domain-containing protein n=1 Tax=Astatotilapia calliptera TaxID=8154 RepID=A0AAX7US40_ASTCA
MLEADFTLVIKHGVLLFTVSLYVKTDCTETAHTSCVACEGGTHMDKPSGLKQCTHCTICDLSRFLFMKLGKTCTSTLDTVCKPEDGFYCVDVAAGSCMAAHKHRQCQPGEYISQTGTAFRDTECSDCSNGTFSDGTLKFCRPHRPCESLNLKLIRPGNATTDAQCEEQDQDNVVPIIIGCLLTILVIGIVIVIVIYVKRKTLKVYKVSKSRRVFLHQKIFILFFGFFYVVFNGLLDKYTCFFLWRFSSQMCNLSFNKVRTLCKMCI